MFTNFRINDAPLTNQRKVEITYSLKYVRVQFRYELNIIYII